MELVYVGLALVVVGCFSSSVGLLFMKWSADVEAELPFCHRRLFILGWIFLVLACSTERWITGDSNFETGLQQMSRPSNHFSQSTRGRERKTSRRYAIAGP